MQAKTTRDSIHLLLLLTALGLGAGACSSKSSSASPADDASVADAGAADAPSEAALPDVPEPAWSGATVEDGCTANGCIHAFRYSVAYTQGLLKKYAAAGFTVNNGVSVYMITYVSDGHEITGSVYVPDSTPPANGFPVVVMNQFTSGIGKTCAPSAGQLGLGVASSTALNGFITIVPDATSYGTTPYGAYLVEKIAGRAALDAARAAFHVGPVIGKKVARAAVVAGLSQGGHSTMSAATEMLGYAPHLEIRGFAAVAPPANFREHFNRDTQADAFGVFAAMRLWSWQNDLGLSGGAIFKDPYAAQVPDWLTKECIYDGANGTAGTLASHFPDGTKASAVLTDAFLGYGKNDSWPDDWAQQYAASTPIPAGLGLPFVIFQGTADTTVPPGDTDEYVGQLKAAGVDVDYRKVDGTQHGSTALSSFTSPQPANDAAVQWIRDHVAQ